MTARGRRLLARFVTMLVAGLAGILAVTRLVTLSVGAADLGLSRVLAACTAGTPAQCQEAIRLANLLLPAECGDDSELGRRLGNLYAEVAEAAPNALIVATGYPLLFELVPGDPDRDLKAQINDATTRLNCAIEKAVADSRAAVVNIVYVDVTEAFAGHGIGCRCTFPLINPPGPGINAFHPTAAGYLAYTEAISAVLPSSWGLIRSRSPNSRFFGLLVRPSVVPALAVGAYECRRSG